MTSVILQEPPHLAASTACRLWGLSPRELHDAYWRTMGVSVARPGSPAAADAGLFLLLGAATTALLDFRKVLELMGWTSPTLCYVRARTPAARPGQPTGGPPPISARCAVTPSAALAGAWTAGDSGYAAWRGLKAQVPPHRRTIARPLGRVLENCPDELLLERLAHLWSDPTLGVVGLKQRGQGVYALEAAAGEGTHACKRLWLGRGRSPAEARPGTVCVLPDAS